MSRHLDRCGADRDGEFGGHPPRASADGGAREEDDGYAQHDQDGRARGRVDQEHQVVERHGATAEGAMAISCGLFRTCRRLLNYSHLMGGHRQRRHAGSCQPDGVDFRERVVRSIRIACHGPDAHLVAAVLRGSRRGLAWQQRESSNRDASRRTIRNRNGLVGGNRFCGEVVSGKRTRALSLEPPEPAAAAAPHGLWWRGTPTEGVAGVGGLRWGQPESRRSRRQSL